MAKKTVFHKKAIKTIFIRQQYSLDTTSVFATTGDIIRIEMGINWDTELVNITKNYKCAAYSLTKELPKLIETHMADLDKTEQLIYL